ncbi:hypothetical protein I4U23_010875 [Adineta vaga]|nr:hypothetical protein I4U23_010875 [Adineta vaga]
MAQGEPHFLKLIHETFTVTHTFTKGLTPSELHILISRATPIAKQRLLQQVRLLSDGHDGQAILLASIELDHKMSNSWVVRAEFKNGKFDLLSVFATQIKELNEAKVAACGVDVGVGWVWLWGGWSVAPSIQNSILHAKSEKKNV